MATSLRHAGTEAPPLDAAASSPAENAERAGARRLVTVLAAVFMAIAAIVTLNLFVTNPTRPVALIFRSGMSDEEMFRAIVNAGGRPIREGRSALMAQRVWLAQGDTPDFPAAARAAGAWLVMNPNALGGCLIRYD